MEKTMLINIPLKSLLFVEHVTLVKHYVEYQKEQQWSGLKEKLALVIGDVHCTLYLNNNLRACLLSWFYKVTAWTSTVVILIIVIAFAGDVVQAVKHAHTIQQEIRVAQSMTNTELYGYSKKLGVDVELLKKTRELGRLPVVNFAAGGLGKLKQLSQL